MNKATSLSIRWPGWQIVSMAVFAIVLIAFSAPGLTAKGGTKGPPTGDETGNNLSAPAIQTDSSLSTSARWHVPAEGAVLGEHYSYGCDEPQSDGQFNYPNTSCVDNLSNPTVYYSVDECRANVPQCADKAIDRIYWQKVAANEWWADDEATGSAAEAAFVDWGDALEAVSWNERSVIRVETQPYSSTLSDDPATEGIYEATLLADDVSGQMPTCAEAASDQGLDPADACKIGFQMWHVAGQGISEHWGVRATDSDDAVSFNYDSPFQIIKSTDARLNLAKIEAGASECSMPGGNPGDDPPEVGNWTGSGWEGTCTWSDIEYTVETSVGGKYVYGYNWRMKDVDLSACEGGSWLKTGFWRLTFYAPEDVTFDIRDEAVIAANIVNKAPPAVVAQARALVEEAPVFITSTTPTAVAAAEESEEEEEDPDADDRLYRPVIDNDNNLTYLDICIVGKTSGGGGGSKGGGGGGSKGGGGGGSKGGSH